MTKRRSTAATRQPKPKPKAWLVLLLGDLHTLSDTGICIPNYPMASKDNRPYSASKLQLWLYNSLQDLLKQTKERARDHRLSIRFGGDMCDGVNHHDSTQTQGNDNDQIDMAVKLLMPFVNIADNLGGVTGTEAHVRQQGSNDWTIYRELGLSAIGAHLETLYDGRLLWQRHHGINVGAREWTKDNPLFATAKDVHYWCQEHGRRQPDCIVAHDQHRSPPPVTAYGITVGVCGCWQTPTYYGDNWNKLPDIGAMFWTPQYNHLERILYDPPQIHQPIK